MPRLTPLQHRAALLIVARSARRSTGSNEYADRNMLDELESALRAEIGDAFLDQARADFLALVKGGAS